jgi:hypothetical protein
VTVTRPRTLLKTLLALSSPLLMLLALLALLDRQGRDRLAALPALVIGGGLMVTSRVHRRHRRHALLMALRSTAPQRQPISGRLEQ